MQVSRLGNPLFNEVIVPMADKDRWNTALARPGLRSSPSTSPSPNWPSCCRCCIPACSRTSPHYTADRADLLAILLTGIPAGIVPGFQNFTGTTQADMLRLNVAIPPAASQNILGILGGDLAGFPNGRRVQDDITTIELRAIAGATIPLVDPTFTADGAAALISDGTAGRPCRRYATADERVLPRHVPVPGSPQERLRDRPAERRCTMTHFSNVAGDAHEQAHRHGIAHSHEPAPRGGPVVMDIGGDIGGLIVRLNEFLEGTELPIEFVEEPQRDIHTGVWRRSLGGESVVVAVYPELRQGSYRIHPGKDHTGAHLEIIGGQVAQLDLRL